MIAVTTHSHAKRLRYVLPMAAAARLIQRELKRAPGCERYASVIAGPREFWTLTIWRDRSELRERMRDGAHAEVMWRQPYWLDCYWGMRWRPGESSSGSWEGEPWRWPEGPGSVRDPGASEDPEALSVVPSWMKAALGQTVSMEQRRVAGAAGATYRLRVPPWKLAAALRDLRRLRRVLTGDPELFRLSLGVGTDGALYLLAVAMSAVALERLRARAEHQRLLGRWGHRLWWSTWEPESEFGRWDGEQLRDGRLAGEAPLAEVRLVQRDAARRARRVLRAHLAVLEATSLDEVELLTSELVANSVRHAELEPTDPIRLRVWITDDRVRVEVVDRGKRFEPHVPLAKASEDQSGWGLYMVDRIAERWGITDRAGERHVWFELRVARSPDRTVSAASHGRS